MKRIQTVIKSLPEADTDSYKESTWSGYRELYRVYLKRIQTVIKSLPEADTDRYKEST